ncbi:MAG: hypothetical protein AAGC93_08010 [Cyanobacteria bacterium P01_F01_bin.53]
MNNVQGVPCRTHRRPCRGTVSAWLNSLLASFLATLSVQYALTNRLGSFRLSGWKLLGTCLGAVLFFSIVTHADSASAQLFKTAESQVKTIFGNNIDASIVTFIFGVLRIIFWVTAVGFIFFAVYQAQRGEQWQPLMQNAFIVIAAVVVVEGMSQLFFGGTTGTATTTGGT